MTKQEFLTSLQETLAAEMNGQQVMDQVRYYSAYIDGQIAEGRTEAEVLAELGDAGSLPGIFWMGRSRKTVVTAKKSGQPMPVKMTARRVDGSQN